MCVTHVQSMKNLSPHTCKLQHELDEQLKNRHLIANTDDTYQTLGRISQNAIQFLSSINAQLLINPHLRVSPEIVAIQQKCAQFQARRTWDEFQQFYALSNPEISNPVSALWLAVAGGGVDASVAVMRAAAEQIMFNLQTAIGANQPDKSFFTYDVAQFFSVVALAGNLPELGQNFLAHPEIAPRIQLVRNLAAQAGVPVPDDEQRVGRPNNLHNQAAPTHGWFTRRHVWYLVSAIAVVATIVLRTYVKSCKYAQQQRG